MMELELSRQIRPYERKGMRFEESMAQVSALDPAHLQDPGDWPKAVLSYLLCTRPDLRPELKDIAQRFFGPDHRNGWNSWLITLRGHPVLWCDGPISEIPMLTPVELESA